MNFDRCAISSFLYPPPAAVGLNAWSLTVGSEQTRGQKQKALQQYTARLTDGRSGGT